MPRATTFRLQAKTCLYLAGYAAEPWVVISLAELAEELRQRADRASRDQARSARSPTATPRAAAAKRAGGR
jgi:hypothetical protein